MNQYIGKTLGAYQILEQIGQGGMATIFKAYQPAMDRYVAVKVLPSHFTEDETFVARFTQEARTLARLEHPHILPVHDYGEQEGVTYLVMRYIDAGTLKDLIARGGPLELEQAARILDQVGRALGYAHSQEVIHRDIKPANIMIDAGGNTFLTDFGIAKLVAGTAQFTATGAIVGTPAYMAPEQGMADPVDHRSDIYALGVVLYEMVTGRVPFEAETPLAVLLQHVNAPLPPPRLIKPDLPEKVERVILKAMAKAPDDRFQTAEDMVEALQKALADAPTKVVLPFTPAEPAHATISVQPVSVPAPEPPPETVVVTPGRKPRPWLPIAGGVAALLVLLIAALLILPNLGRKDETPTAKAPPTDEMPVEVAPTSPPPGAPVRSSIVVDNEDALFFVLAGDWGTCIDGDCGGVSYGFDFRYAEPGCTSCQVRFDFTVEAAGEYDVWTWWPQGDDRATDAPFTITYGDDSLAVNVDQRSEGNEWYRLATLFFEAGESVSIAVQGSASGFVNADAVALTVVGAVPPAQTGTVVEPVELPSGWSSYSNGNLVYALALQDDYLWAGGDGGLVRWDLEDGSYVKLGISDGLASNVINDLLVDEDDNLWVATDAGVNRFDGETWITFDETDGLDADGVLSLFLDDEGALWAGTDCDEYGLNYYDGTSWGPSPLPPMPLDCPNPIAFALYEDWGLFVGLLEGDLAYFDGEAWEVLTQDDGLPGETIYDLLLVEETLLVSYEDEVVRFDLETDAWDTIPQLSGMDVMRMHWAADDSLWFASEEGAARYDPETGDWRRFEPGPGTIPSRIVTDIVEDEDGLWFGTHGGVVFYDGDGWELWATDDGLGGNDVSAIRQDGSGALWFVHDGSGLSRYDPASEEWQTFDEDDGLTDWPSYPGVDGEGHLWIGTYETLWRYGEGGWQRFEPHELKDVEIWGIVFGPGVQWLWTDDGLLRHDAASGEWTHFDDADYPGLEDVEMLYVTRDGTLLVNRDDALIRYDGSEWRALPLEQVENVGEITAAPDGSPWIVADGDLYHLEGERWARFGWPGGGWIESVAIGADGSVWAGHEGLGRLDPTSGEWQLFTSADGLIDDYVQAIYVTSEGVVWVGTAGGVSRYVPEE
jgi:serine/threonine protein kinase/ligand-binding sensor domain-containing protein